MVHPTGKTDQPRTPIVKRLFRDVLKPTLALGKRSRDAENVPPTPQKPKPHCVALQNDDEDEDAVVVSALHTVPFCCHADLLAMGRAELIAAAETLNVALPAALRIDAGARRSDAFIRHSIELLVGINTGTRKRDRSLSLYDVSASADNVPHALPPSPVSPLRTYTAANTPRLASLREEDENCPVKRRRMVAPPDTPTPQRTGAVVRSSTPLPRRAQSQRMPVRPLGIPRNVTLTRGGRRPRSQSAVLTSTPKARQIVTKAVCAAPEESFRSVATGVSGSTTVECDLNGRREWVAEWLDGNMATEDVSEVVSGLEGLSLATTASTLSDMQLSDGE